MNPDLIEKELRDCMAAAGLERHDPTPGWKREILAEAALSRGRTPSSLHRAPRLLLVVLGAAWCLIVALHLTTPDTRDGRPLATAGPDSSRARDDEFRLPPWSALMALNSQLPSADLP